MPKNKSGESRFAELLKRRGLKYTYERKSIYAEVAKLKEHFDADQLYERFKTHGLRISRDTVYRTIPLLLEAGILQKSVGEGKREFFERTSARGHHDHMVCIRCGRFIEFHNDDIERIQEQVCQKHGFKLTFHDHRLYGECRECQKR